MEGKGTVIHNDQNTFLTPNTDPSFVPCVWSGNQTQPKTVVESKL